MTCLLAASLGPAAAARFGVPDTIGDPPGYFVLTGPQIPTGLGNFSWGDNLHGLDLHVEVTGTTLVVDVYDPGLVGVDAAGLDAFFNGTIGQVTYRLLDPSGTQLAARSFGSDDAATNRSLVRLYDGPAVPGLHRIEVRMDDTATDDQDVNAFGLSVPGYDAYTYAFTGGEVNLSGATITQPLVVWPHLAWSTPDTLAGEPLTGIDVATWDLDSATSPPVVRLETANGRGVDLAPSPDSGLFVTNLRGINVGPLDCSDYGVYRLSVDQVDAATEGGNDVNVFTMQIYDYDAAVTPAEFPIAGGDPRRPVRLYLPTDAGAAPLKERLGQTARVVSGPDPPAPGVTSVLEIRVELDNPAAYALTSVDLVARAATSPRLGPPVVTGASGGLVATAAGAEVRALGDVPAGGTGFVTYEVAWTPAVPGLEYLTGDGSDLQGGTLPTEAAYATPFEPSARLGPVCMLRAEAVTPTCSARAIIGGNLFICEGEDVVLDATGSSLTGCPGVLEHRWLRDGVELFAFPGPPTLSDAPLTDAVYELEIRCDVAPSCSDSSAVTVRVEPDVAPGPVGDSLRVNEVPGGYLFTWSVNGARSYNLWRDVDPLLPIATRTLVANVPAGSHLLPPAPRVRYRVDYYLVFAASCAGTEGP